jgi:hypothetical protein
MGRAFLTADLDCTSSGGHLQFYPKGQLELRGFTLTGGVLCGGTCKITGPGTITGSGEHGVRATVKVKLIGVTITGSAENGVEAHNFAETAKAVIKNSTITGNAGMGVNADKGVQLSGSTVSNNGGHGVRMGESTCHRGRLVVKGSNVSGNGTAPACGVSAACADLASCSGPPRLSVGASCGTSYVLGSGIPGSAWGVCSLD